MSSCWPFQGQHERYVYKGQVDQKKGQWNWKPFLYVSTNNLYYKQISHNSMLPKVKWNLKLLFSNLCLLYKGQIKSKWFFQAVRRFLQKTNKWIQFYYYETCFRSFFGGNWRHQNDISKLTDLLNKHWFLREVKCTIVTLNIHGLFSGHWPESPGRGREKRP